MSPVECEFIQGSKLSSGWYPYTIKNKAVIKDDGYPIFTGNDHK
ncbi:MAG: hypothetical protein ACLRQF_09615 [Thomasclavelia ramosa]